MPRETVKVEQRTKAIYYRLHNIGDYFTGLLLGNPVKRQATDMESGQPSVNAKGEPRYEYIYELLHVDTNKHPESCHWCSVRTSEDDFVNDSGFRKFSAKPGQHFAIQDAVREAKNSAGQNELYGPLTLKLVGKKKPEQGSGQKFASNVYEASYSIPTDEQVARVDAFNGVAEDEPDQAEIAETFKNILDLEDMSRLANE